MLIFHILLTLNFYEIVCSSMVVVLNKFLVDIQRQIALLQLNKIRQYDSYLFASTLDQSSETQEVSLFHVFVCLFGH